MNEREVEHNEKVAIIASACFILVMIGLMISLVYIVHLIRAGNW